MHIRTTIRKSKQEIEQKFRTFFREPGYKSVIMRTLAAGAFLFFIAIMTELCTTMDFDGFFASCSFSHAEYKASDFEITNCNVEGRTIITTTDDPQLYIENINDYMM